MGFFRGAKGFTFDVVQRLFSMFPPGGPGIGLFLLRVSVAATFVCVTANQTGIVSIHHLLLGALAIAVCLVAGLLTPYLSFVVCVYALANLFRVSAHSDVLAFASLLLNSAALALLGPGAYSFDARLFGRRVVVVPPRKDPGET